MQSFEATTFEEGDKVLCYHLGLLYEAKVLKRDAKIGSDSKQVQYLVHYNGWKKTWDEWVPESKLLMINDENCEKQKELRVKAGNGASTSGGNDSSGGGSSIQDDPAADAQPPPPPPLPPTTSSLSDLLGIAPFASTSASKPARRPRPNYYEPDDYALELQMSHNGEYGSSSKSSKSSSIGGAQKENNNNGCDKNINRRGNQCQNGGNKRSSSQKVGGLAVATSANSHQRTPFAPALSPAMMVVGGTSTRPIIAGASGVASQRSRAGQRPTVDDPKDGAKRRRVELPIVIPEPLKRILVEDWDMVSRRTHLVVIPAAVTADTLLGDYLKQREALPDPCIRSEFVASLKEYFNVMLGPQLLYRFERNQFNALEESETSRHESDDAWVFAPIKFYGAVHLLRLFVKLGSVLSYTPLNQEESRMLLDVTHDFLEFLVDNQSRYFQLKILLDRAPKAYVEVSAQNGDVGV